MAAEPGSAYPHEPAARRSTAARSVPCGRDKPPPWRRDRPELVEIERAGSRPRAGHGTQRLVIDDHHVGGAHDQPVDLAGDRAPPTQRDHRYFGQRAGAEQRPRNRDRSSTASVSARIASCCAAIEPMHRPRQETPRRRPRASGASSGRACSRRWISARGGTPRPDRRRAASAAAGSAPSGRDGASGRGGTGSGAGAVPAPSRQFARMAARAAGARRRSRRRAAAA